jgi:ABC-type transport system substrate-binding protein
MFLIVDGLNTTPVEARNFYSPTGYRNVFNSTDPELSKLLDRANQKLDPAKAADIYKEINKFGVENAWYGPVLSRPPSATGISRPSCAPTATTTTSTPLPHSPTRPVRRS